MKLNFSNLKTVSQASLGSAVLWLILIVILAVSYLKLHDVKSVANRISDLRTPTVDASSELKNNLNTALANLRGWMLLKDDSFILQRKESWKQIRNAQNELNQLSENWTNPANVSKLAEVNLLLDKFEASQDKVELIAWDDKNLPATHLLFSQAAPRAELVFQQITKLMDVEQYVPTTPERKKLFTAMANFRGSFAIGQAHIRAFLISADPIFSEKFTSSWQANTDSFEVIKQYQDLFDDKQAKDFTILVNAREKFSPLPKEIFKLRKQNTWNQANYELKNVAAKHGQKLVTLLEEMTRNQNRLLADDTFENEANLDEYLQLLIWLTILAIGSSFAVSYYMKRKVSDPLNAAINEAIILAENVASGNYDTDTDTGSRSSSYETTLLLNSLEGMATDVKRQAKELIQAKEAAEFSVQEVQLVQADLSAQKDAMDQHSLVSITDIKGTITYANDKFCEISGYSQDELIGQNHSLLNSGNEPKNYWRDMYLTVSKGKVWHDEVKNKAKDGHFYWVDTTIVPMYVNDKLSGYTSIRTDITQAKELELEITSAQADLSAQKDAMDQHSLVSITDIKGTITYANDKFCEISGYEQEELIGKNHSLLNSGNEPKNYWRDMYLTVSKGKVWHDEVKNKAKDGHFYWVDTTIVPMYVNDKLSGYTSIRTDITQAKELELEITSAQADLSAQKDAMDQHSLVSITDIKGTITYANDKFCEISGYEQEELIGKNHSLLNSGNEPKNYWRDMYLTVSKGKVWHDEVKNKAKDGHFYWVDTTIVPLYENNKLSGYTSIRTDITKAKELEQTNIAAQADLSAQKDAMDQHSLVSVTDIKGTITYANDKFCEISGYEQEELIGKNHSLLNSGNEPKNYWRDMYLTVSKGKVWHDEVKNKAKDGHFYWVDTTIVPMYENNKLSGYTSIRTDITKAKKLSENLIEARDQAEVANESKTDFLANMSHEIRTPMNGVIGMTNLLLDSNLNQDQFKLAKTVKTSADSLLYIINDILDFSKVEAGMIELEDINFNLGGMLEDLGRAMHYLAEEKGLEFICPANPIINQWVHADPGRLRQVLTNLIGNAIKFTEQGEVAVFCTIEHKDTRRLIRFEIKDTGIGISEAQQAKLFSKFTQADSSTTRKYGGTGLGLSISKKLIDLMGGDIGINSELGKGTTFWITLDLQGVEFEKETPLQLADVQQQKILAVDDNGTNRDLLEQLLTLWKIDHQLVASGTQALQALKECDKDSPFTVGLLDMNMPEMDGAELCKLIKSDSATSDIKLVMLSSQAQRGEAKKMQAIGFDGYLPKPVQQSELYNVIQQVAGLTDDDDTLITRYTEKERMQFKAHILVVEDNITNQLVIKGILEKFGITIDLAGNGQEALVALQQGTDYDLVFMDCQMPVMDGYTATQTIRDPETKGINHTIPIIAMTANVMRGDKEKCLAVGMNDYVAKPIDPAKLRRMLNQWLSNADVSTPVSADVETIVDVAESDAAEVNKELTDLLVFDYEVMNAMLMGDKELMATISETFLIDMAAQIEQLKSIVESNDIDQVATISHRIKGASGNVGGKALSASALEMEMAGKAGDIDKVRLGIEKLENDFTALKNEMVNKLV